MSGAEATPGTRYPEHLREEVDRYLEHMHFAVDADTRGLEDAMRYSLLAGGKRIRPVLALASARAIGLEAADMLPLAGAIELIHTYSLIHDDLPAMDDDELRRGRPTCHRVFGEDVAILAGDALYAEAFRHLLTCQRTEPRLVLEAAAELALATGVNGMVGGQYLDIRRAGGVARRAAAAGGGSAVAPDVEAAPADPGATGVAEGEGEPSRATGAGGGEAAAASAPSVAASGTGALRRVHELKTGRLIGASVSCVLLLGAVGEPATIAFRRFAAELGVLFQIVDDILDVTGTDAALGKPSGSDERHGRHTYVSEFGIERARALAGESHSAAREALAEAVHAGAAVAPTELEQITDFIYKRTS